MRRVQAVLLVSLVGLMFGVLGLQASPPDDPITQAVKEVQVENLSPGPIVGHLAGENGRLSISQTILDVAVKGDYAYLGTIDGLQIVDISQPDTPQWHSIFEPIPMTRIKIRDDYGYVLSSQYLCISTISFVSFLSCVGANLT